MVQLIKKDFLRSWRVVYWALKMHFRTVLKILKLRICKVTSLFVNKVTFSLLPLEVYGVLYGYSMCKGYFIYGFLLPFYDHFSIFVSLSSKKRTPNWDIQEEFQGQWTALFLPILLNNKWIGLISDTNGLLTFK